ncbi:hypothetical protein, partial [Halorubrum sp. Eb13]|uniref:hypothetical protein n=1 Tax=Halorubrum sp. Eb13 TaxID=1383843 RepID=UPI001C3DA7F0
RIQQSSSDRNRGKMYQILRIPTELVLLKSLSGDRIGVRDAERIFNRRTSKRSVQLSKVQSCARPSIKLVSDCIFCG